MKEKLFGKLKGSVYIHSSRNNENNQDILDLFSRLALAGYNSFFFSNNADLLIALAIKFCKTNNVKLYVVHNLSDQYYFFKEVEHLFIEDGVDQDAYLKRYCALQI